MLPTATLLTANGLYLGSAFRTNPSLFWILDLTQFVFVPLLSIWALWRFGRVRPQDYGLGRLVDDEDLLSAIALYSFVISVFAFGYGTAKFLAIFVPWGWPPSGFSYSDAFPSGPVASLAVLAYVSLSAAFVEEIIYRGLPAAYLSARMALPRLKLLYPLISALAFALIHWENGSREFVATFLLGIVLAALYIRIRNLWPFVVGHAVTDMLAFTGYYGS